MSEVAGGLNDLRKAIAIEESLKNDLIFKVTKKVR
jgi:hypothetical protein